MFNAKHYIPILRWKTAEKEALQKLAAGDKQVITPLLELVMPPRKRPKKGEKPKTAEDNLADSVARLQALMPTMPAQILKYWGSEPIFVDLNLFTDAFLKIWGYEEVMQKGYEAGIAPIPVVHLEDDTRVEDKIISLAKQHDSGVCLRVLRSDISKPDVAAKINALLSKHSLQKGQVDLLIDFELVEKMPTADYQVLVDTLSNIPDLTQWRTFIVAAGAFPFDLREFFANNTYRIPRTDWNYWFEKVYSSSLARKPAFADYTIQHPIYSEPNPSANPSASIRYTAEDKWVIVRGGSSP